MTTSGNYSVRQVSVGDRYGHYEVLSPRKGMTALCRCDCGTEKLVNVYTLTKGLARSCGCQRGALVAKNRPTHGMKRSSEYSSWQMMKSRCNNPRYHKWPRYGGRGIKVCERWASFENFYADMGPRPEAKTLHRLDNDGDYGPDNCVWADRKTQARLTYVSHLVTFAGRTQSLAAWAEERGIPYGALHSRIRKGWSADDALTIPVNPGQRIHPFQYTDEWRREHAERVARGHEKAWRRRLGVEDTT